ncbi:MAG: MAPEG family protein [Gammaproteobacteria bacterium]
MNQQLIFQPVIAMFLLTGLVWIYMYARRIAFMVQKNINPQSVSTPELLNSTLPASVNNSSNNLKNLFELPVIFYALCIFLLLIQKADAVFLYSAWLYVALRAIHSLIHCTVNIVKYRFQVYFLSGVVLWFMVARLALITL